MCFFAENGVICYKSGDFQLFAGLLESLLPLIPDVPLLDPTSLTGVGLPATTFLSATQGQQPGVQGPVGLLGHGPPGLSPPGLSISPQQNPTAVMTSQLRSVLRNLESQANPVSSAGSGTVTVPVASRNPSISSVSSASDVPGPSYSHVLANSVQAPVPHAVITPLSATDFEVAEGSEVVKKVLLQSTNWTFLRKERDILLEADKKFKELTGSHLRGDIPFPEEHFYDYRAMCPSDQSARSSCTLGVDDGRTKIILVTDSVGSHFRFSAPGNSFVATFTAPGVLHDTRYSQTVFTNLSQGLEFDVGHIAISGLGAVYNNNYTPSELHDKICWIFGVDKKWRPDFLAFRLGTNDLKSYQKVSSNGTYRTEEVEEGAADSTESLIDVISQWARDVSVELNGAPVAWIGSGCPSQTCANPGMKLSYQYFPQSAQSIRNKRFDDMLSHLVALLEVKGMSKFQDVVSSDGKGTVIGKFIIFPSDSPINSGMSGTGHVHSRDYGKFVANLLNTLGILVCKLRGKDDTILRFLCRAGIPSRWDADFKVLPHSQNCWMRPEDVVAVDKQVLKKQSDWEDCVCRGLEEYPYPQRNFGEVQSHDVDLKSGQIVKVRRHENDPIGLGDGGMVVCYHNTRDRVLVFLFSDCKVHDVPIGLISLYQAWVHILYSTQREVFLTYRKNRKKAKESFKKPASKKRKK